MISAQSTFSNFLFFRKFFELGVNFGTFSKSMRCVFSLKFKKFTCLNSIRPDLKRVCADQVFCFGYSALAAVLDVKFMALCYLLNFKNVQYLQH